MRYAIALMIIAAVTAHGAVRKGVEAIDDGHESYRIVTYSNSNGVRPAGLLWFGVTVPRAYVEVVESVTNELEEVEVITNTVPVPHALCKWQPGDDSPTSRTEAELAAYDAMVAAAAQAAQYAQLQAVVDAAGPQIKMLENIIDWYIDSGVPIARPISANTAIPAIYGWIMVQADADLRDEANTKATVMLALFSGLKEAGLTEATINAVWAYMQATGQDQ